MFNSRGNVRRPLASDRLNLLSETMFGMKSKKEKLEAKLARLLAEAYRLSHTDRRKSDETLNKYQNLTTGYLRTHATRLGKRCVGSLPPASFTLYNITYSLIINLEHEFLIC